MMVRILTIIIDFYKLVISPYIPVCCRYYPSCSQYSKEAIIRHGIFYGCFLSIKRIVRCNPFGGFGYDPVPEIVDKNLNPKV